MEWTCSKPHYNASSDRVIDVVLSPRLYATFMAEASLVTEQRARTLNLAAGPSSLPTSVLVEAAQGLLDFQGTGIGLVEWSHRSQIFQSFLKQAENDLRKLAEVPDDFAVLWFQGGGLSQFHMTALNLQAAYRIKHKCNPTASIPADYIITGAWTQKAAKEAQRLGIAVNTVTDSRKVSADGKSFEGLAPADTFQWSKETGPEPAYIYYCANETINGIEIDPPVVPVHLAKVPLVADMSSNILSKPIPWKEHNFGVIYAGAQKNIGPSGLTIVLVRKDLLVDLDDAVQYGGPRVPVMDSYKIMADNNSLANTPPMFPIYVAALVFAKLLREGGLTHMDKINEAKASKIYTAIEDSNGTYIPKVTDKNVRSRMNIVFGLKGGDDEDKRFVAEAEKQGIKQVKGHRCVTQSCSPRFRSAKQKPQFRRRHPCLFIQCDHRTRRRQTCSFHEGISKLTSVVTTTHFDLVCLSFV